MSYVVSILLPMWAEGGCIGVIRLHSYNAVIEFVLMQLQLSASLFQELHIINAPLVITIFVSP